MRRLVSGSQHDFHRLRARVNDILDRACYRPERGSASPKRWSPPADIFAAGDTVRITVELCGMKREEVDVTVERGVLTVSGERRAGQAGEGETPLHSERPLGCFERSFALSWEPGSVEAELTDGVLTVTLTR